MQMIRRISAPAAPTSSVALISPMHRMLRTPLLDVGALLSSWLCKIEKSPRSQQHQLPPLTQRLFPLKLTSSTRMTRTPPGCLELWASWWAAVSPGLSTCCCLVWWPWMSAWRISPEIPSSECSRTCRSSLPWIDSRGVGGTAATELG